MLWETDQSSYGSFYPQWKRSYLTHLPDRERERTRISMSNRARTTQNEIGQWYSWAKHQPSEVFQAREPLPYARNDEPLYFPRPWSPPKSVALTERSLQTPRLPPLPDISSRASQGSRAWSYRGSKSRQSHLPLPDVRNIDVQLLTTDNTLISVAPVSETVETASYPRIVNDVALPNIREVNVKFKLKGDKSVDIRAAPILADD